MHDGDYQAQTAWDVSARAWRKRAINEERIEQARAMMLNSKLKVKSILKTLGVSKATLYKYVPMGKSASGDKKSSSKAG